MVLDQTQTINQKLSSQSLLSDAIFRGQAHSCSKVRHVRQIKLSNELEQCVGQQRAQLQRCINKGGKYIEEDTIKL